MIAVVALVGAARWFTPQEPVATDLAVPAQAWDATSTQPSYGEMAAPVEINALPALPTESEWAISSLPKSTGPSFQPLPKMDGDQSLGRSEFEIRPLPAVGNSGFKSIDKVASPNGLEFPISDYEIRDLPIINSDPQDFEIRSLPVIGQQQSEAKSELTDEVSPTNDFEFGISDFEIPNSKTGNSQPENLTPEVSHQRQAKPIKPDSTDFASARRLRALPLPEFESEPWQHPSFEEAQKFPVTSASAELEIAGPNRSALSSQFSGAKINGLPKELADRIAALEPKKKKKVVAAPKKGEKKPPPKSASSKDDFKLAAQPKIGDHYAEDKPQTDNCAHLIQPLASDFSDDPLNEYLPYDAWTQMDVYQGKTLNANQRPLVELGRPWYQLGQLSPGSSALGFHNNVTPQFLIFGDSRVAYASNNQNGQSDSLIATQLNLDFDLKLTATERFHAFVSPTGGAQHNRYLLDEDRYVFEGDANIDFGFFEGDLGAIVGGAIGKTLPFDLPFTVGIIPLVFQNGIWLEDAFLGFAATLPARNSPRFNISNMDLTFFAGYDKIDSDAFPGDDSAARVIGFASFIEALNGYIEADYAFLDDRTFDDRSYHNIGIGYTRRYGRFLSNSTRVIVNAGQSTDVVENTADGVLLLSENSLITGHPSNIVPYFNMFAGFDRPQSVARAGASGGVLRNTGILFESDNLTGYPTLDATANDTYGFAAGINILSQEFSQQLVLETAMLGVMGDAANRRAQGDQFGVGFRYQLPVSNSVIFRADGMMGFLRNDDDVSGIRVEVRKKF